MALEEATSWVAKTRWIKCQPESRKIYKFPAEGYQTRNADGTEKKEPLWNSH